MIFDPFCFSKTPPYPTLSSSPYKYKEISPFLKVSF